MDAVSYRAILRLDAVGELLLATLLARLAERMFGLVLVLYALHRFHSPFLAGCAGFVALAPGLAISPIAGALLDRAGPAWGIAADMACSAACILALALPSVARLDGPVPMLCLAALYSLTNPLSGAGVRTLLPSLVPPPARSRANALDTSIHAAVDVCGPALAGALTGLAGATTAMFAIAALYGAAGISLLPALRRRAQTPRTWRHGLLVDAAAGVAYVLRHASLRPLALGYATFNMGWGILLVAVPVFVLRSIRGGANADIAVGVLWAASGVAAAAGALLVGRYMVPGRERGLMMSGMVATAVAIWPVCVSFGLPGMAIGLMLVGVLAGPVDVGVLTLRQNRTDPAWLGRVMAVSMGLNLSGAPFGFVLGGTLLTWSVQAAFATSALACCAGALMLHRVPRR